MTQDIEEVYAFMRDVISTGMHLEGDDRFEMMMEIARWVSKLDHPAKEQALNAMREGAWYGTGPLMTAFDKLEGNE